MRRRRGIYLGAIYDPLVDVATSIFDDIGELGKALGVSELTDALKAALDVVMKDKTFQTLINSGPAGITVVRVFALACSSASAGLAAMGTMSMLAGPPPLGQVLGVLEVLAGTFGGIVSVALPGLVRGESFVTAFVKEGLWRIETTAAILAPGLGTVAANAAAVAAEGLIGEALDDTVKSLTDRWIKDDLGPWVEEHVRKGVVEGPDWLAQKLGLSRPDVALQSLAWTTGRDDDLARWRDYQRASDFDPLTGTRAGSMLAPGYKPPDLFGTDESPAEQRARLEREKRARELAAITGRSLSSSNAAAFGIAPRAEAVAVAIPGSAAFVKKTTTKDAAPPPEEPRNSTASTVALVVLVGAAGVALWRWYVWEQAQRAPRARAA